MGSETRWTKGPWVVFTPEDYDGPRQLPGLGVESVSGEAVVWYCDEPETGLGNDADAHLIAAAPDGYALAELVMDYCGNPKGMSDQQRDELYEVALQFAKKARGEQS